MFVVLVSLQPLRLMNLSKHLETKVLKFYKMQASMSMPLMAHFIFLLIFLNLIKSLLKKAF